MLKTETIDYQEGNTHLEAYCAYEDNKEKKPAVIVIHDWSGRNDFANKKAEQLAELGYVGFALDMYGKGKLGETTEEKSALMQPLINDRGLLLKRLEAALNTVRKLDCVDSSRIGAIGFCFGGLCALDLARSGADVKGVVSFHGLLFPSSLPAKTIQAKVLVLHGHDDPMAPPTEVLAFEDEMTKAKTDWQLYTFGHTKHAFTNPEAHDDKLGLVYNNVTAKRAWIAMENFFTEVL